MATTYTITRPNAASYDFDIELDTAFATATTIRWEIVPVAGMLPSATLIDTVEFTTTQTEQRVSPPATRSHKFPRDFEIRLYNDADDTLLFTLEEQSIAGDLGAASGDWILNGGVDKNVIGLGFTDIVSSTTGGTGNDTFVITRFQYGNVTIDDLSVDESDPDGSLNVIKFDYGVSITGYSESSAVLFGQRGYNSVELTLETGAVLTIQSPNGLYRYQIGDGAMLNYLEFKAAIGVTPTTASANAGLLPENSAYADELNSAYTIDSLTSSPILSREPAELDTSLEMSGGISEDIFTLARDTKLSVTGGTGNDVFVVSRFQSGNATIDDLNGNDNLIKFDYNVSIKGYEESSAVLFGQRGYNSVELTLETGAVITVLSPNGLYNYQLGDGDVLDYLGFKAAIGVVATTESASANLTASDANYADELTSAHTISLPSESFKVTGILSVSHPEDVGEGDALATFKAVLVRDENADVTYSITEGNADGMFRFAKNDDGEFVLYLVSGESFDYEDDSIPNPYKLTVQLSASGVEPESVEVTINVRDVNDEAPVLADVGGVRTATIVENVEGADAGDISFTVTDADADSSFTADSFTISAGAGTSPDTAEKFEVVHNGDKWDLKVRATDNDNNPVSLDYETDGDDGRIELNVKVNDGVADSDPVPITITLTNLNDNNPKLGEAVWYDNTFRDNGVREDTDIGTPLFSVAGTDADNPPFLSYRIISINDEAYDQSTSPFAIDAGNGPVGLQRSLDYETKQSHKLVIQAFDEDGKASNEVEVTVNVINIPDGVVELSAASVDVNERSVKSLGVGVTVTEGTYQDADFTVLGADGNADDRFDVVWDATNQRGVLRVTKPIDYEGFDEADRVGLPNIPIALTIQVAGDSTPATFTYNVVNIDDVAPKMGFAQGAGSIAEDVAGADTGITFVVSDEDTPISTTGRTADMTDIDPDSFTIAAQAITQSDDAALQAAKTASADFADKFELAYDSTADNWKLKLRDLMSIDYDDTNLPADKILRFSVHVTDNGNKSSVVRDANIVVEAPPSLIKGNKNANTLTGTAVAEYINGKAGADTINGGGGDDHILGGVGNDEITLSSAKGSVETIYYRFRSEGSFVFARDGEDTITDFRRGEDKLVLMDETARPIDLTRLLSDTPNLGTTAIFRVKPIFDDAITADNVKLTGFILSFGEGLVTINYATDSHVTVRSGGSWQTAGDPYLGALSGGTPSEYSTSSNTLTDKMLLENYFNIAADDDNLQVVDDATITIF